MAFCWLTSRLDIVISRTKATMKLLASLMVMTMGFLPSSAFLQGPMTSPARVSQKVVQQCERQAWRGRGVVRTAAAVGEMTDVEILAQAEPHIQKFRGQTVVIKYGGHAMENADLKAKFASDIVLLKQLGINVVVVHGGGPQIAAMLKRLNVESNFIQGLRVTDAPTLEVAEMVLCGLVNKEIASLIKKGGARAIGISGRDDGLLVGTRARREYVDEQGNKKVADLGFVGEPKTVNTQILTDLIAAGVVPVVAPIGLGEGGETLNINADTAAGAVAGALRAKRLLLLTDVPGVLNKEKVLMSEIKMSQVESLKEDGTVTGGMIPKLEMAASAVEQGVEGSVILDGRVPHAVLLQLLSDKAVGTLVTE